MPENTYVDALLQLCLDNSIGTDKIELDGEIHEVGRRCIRQLIDLGKPDVLDRTCDLLADLGLWPGETGFNYGGDWAPEDEAALQKLFDRWRDKEVAPEPATQTDV